VKTYGEACGVARALDVVGERWTLLVVRELLLGPKRFTDLEAGLPGGRRRSSARGCGAFRTPGSSPVGVSRRQRRRSSTS